VQFSPLEAPANAVSAVSAVSADNGDSGSNGDSGDSGEAATQDSLGRSPRNWSPHAHALKVRFIFALIQSHIVHRRLGRNAGARSKSSCVLPLNEDAHGQEA
jgi:hypothetical protein